MKKVLLILLTIISTITLTACGDTKVPPTESQFTESLTAKNFTIENQTDTLNIATLKSYYIATESQGRYKYEYYVFENEAAAQGYYVSKRDSLGGQGQNSEVTSGNIAKYTQIASDGYSVVSRVGSAILYTKAPNELRELVKEEVKEIGF